MTVYLLSDDLSFPHPDLAGKDGLLAVGGDLGVERLLLAYQHGIFPWYSDGEPIIWWSPDPRLVLYPDRLKISRSLKKTIRQKKFTVTIDTAFEDVIHACANARRMKRKETWITDDMIEAYTCLHTCGFAHSVEAWHQGRLAGGLYGVSLGRCFFGESMFTIVDDASKVAFVYLVDVLKKMSVDFIDCQVTTEHLMQFGAVEIERKRFLMELGHSLNSPTIKGKWSFTASDVLTNLSNKNK